MPFEARVESHSGQLHTLGKREPHGYVGSNPTSTAKILGGLAEWTIALVLKTRGRNPYTGSNPVPTAMKNEINPKLASKASARIALNRTLIGIVIGVFFLTINLRKELFFQKALVLQLVVSIPFLLTSILAYSKVAYRTKTEKWNNLAWFTFIVGYAFIINIIGILLASIAGKAIAIIFFASSWILSITYSLVDISCDKKAIKERVVKDALFILITTILGAFVALGIINF